MLIRGSILGEMKFELYFEKVEKLDYRIEIIEGLGFLVLGVRGYVG